MMINGSLLLVFLCVYSITPS